MSGGIKKMLHTHTKSPTLAARTILFGDWRAARSVRILFRSLSEGRSDVTKRITVQLQKVIAEHPEGLFGSCVPGSGEDCGFSWRY